MVRGKAVVALAVMLPQIERLFGRVTGVVGCWKSEGVGRKGKLGM
jgi:hypothetical protein